MEAALTEGFPIVFGFSAPYPVPSTLAFPFQYDAKIPNGTDAKNIWGHAVLCVGFDRTKGLFTILNSWGSSWGDGGFFYMPYGWFQAPDCQFNAVKDGTPVTWARVSDFWVLKMNQVQKGPTDSLIKPTSKL